jgi:hypothetical protein
MTMPSAPELADAFAAFGEGRRAAVVAVRALPDVAQWIAVDPRVRWLPAGHPAVPAQLAKHLDRVRHLSPTGTPSICGRRPDGQACVVLGRPEAIAHELIQVALGLATREMRERIVAGLVAEGDALLAAARDAVRQGTPADDFADLTMIREDARALDLEKIEWIAGFQARLTEACRPALSTFAFSHGLATDQALRASVYAAYLNRMKPLDPHGVIGMALVAYRYETDPEASALHDLYRGISVTSETATA